MALLGDHVLHELPGGGRLITAPMPQRTSASVVLMFGVGSRYEEDQIGGVSHFIEHLFFKGTRKRPSAKEVAEAIEGVGGVMNASTDKELTMYWARVPGGIDSTDALKLVERHLALPPTPNGLGYAAAPAALTDPTVLVLKKETEQAHICLGTRAISYLDLDRFTLDLVNTVLGEGMSSRLFLEIRERRGLAYDVHSYTSKHHDAGYFAVYMGVDPKKAEEAVNAAVAERHRIAEIAIGDQELNKAKEVTKGRLRLGLEGTNALASWLCQQ